MNLHFPSRRPLFEAAAPGLTTHAATPPQQLMLDVYNPGSDAIFPVSSVLVSGHKEVILIDAQFGKTQAQHLVNKIRASGKQLTTIYISHGDPDYYFGLGTLVAAFPKAKVLASAATIAHINESKDSKLEFWGPKMGADAPETIVVPEELEGNHLELEGQSLEVIGLCSKQPDRTFVWIPSIKAVVGGVIVADGIHVWMADAFSVESHEGWMAILDRIEALNPVTVVPGHYLGKNDRSIKSVQFTREYITVFDEETAKAKHSTDLINAMKTHYPNVGTESSLLLSAKVAKGEITW